MVLVLLVAMGFAAANAGHRVVLSLGFVTFYNVPVTLVAFSGLFVGMVVMFGTGIHTDLKVRKILRDRLAEESRQEQTWIDRNQRDLFEDGRSGEAGADEASVEESVDASRAGSLEVAGEVNAEVAGEVNAEVAGEAEDSQDAWLPDAPPAEHGEDSEPESSQEFERDTGL